MKREPSLRWAGSHGESLVGFTSEPFRHVIEREKNWASCLAGLECDVVADGFH
jgi:hypothetical protein